MAYPITQGGHNDNSLGHPLKSSEERLPKIGYFFSKVTMSKQTTELWQLKYCSLEGLSLFYDVGILGILKSVQRIF